MSAHSMNPDWPGSSVSSSSNEVDVRPFITVNVNGVSIIPPSAPSRSNSGLQHRGENVHSDRQRIRPFDHHRVVTTALSRLRSGIHQLHRSRLGEATPSLAFQQHNFPTSPLQLPNPFAGQRSYGGSHRLVLPLNLQSRRPPSDPSSLSISSSSYPSQSSGLSDFSSSAADSSSLSSSSSDLELRYRSRTSPRSLAQQADLPRYRHLSVSQRRTRTANRSPALRLRLSHSAGVTVSPRTTERRPNGPTSFVRPSLVNRILATASNSSSSSLSSFSSSSSSASASLSSAMSATAPRSRKRRAPGADEVVIPISSSSPVRPAAPLPPPAKRRATRASVSSASSSAPAPATSSRQAAGAASTTSSSQPTASRRRTTPAVEQRPQKLKEEEEDEAEGLEPKQPPITFDDSDIEDLTSDVIDLVDREVIPVPEPPKEDNSVRLGTFQCVICMDDCADLTVTHCGHLFCSECLHSSLHIDATKKICPICRTKIDTNPASGRFTNKSKGFWPLELKLMTRRRTEKRVAR